MAKCIGVRGRARIKWGQYIFNQLKQQNETIRGTERTGWRLFLLDRTIGQRHSPTKTTREDFYRELKQQGEFFYWALKQHGEDFYWALKQRGEEFTGHWTNRVNSFIGHWNNAVKTFIGLWNNAMKTLLGTETTGWRRFWVYQTYRSTAPLNRYILHVL